MLILKDFSNAEQQRPELSTTKNCLIKKLHFEESLKELFLSEKKVLSKHRLLQRNLKLVRFERFRWKKKKKKENEKQR